MYFVAILLLAISASALPHRDLDKYSPGPPVPDNIAPGIMPISAPLNNNDDLAGQPMLLPAPLHPGQRPPVDPQPLPIPLAPPPEPKEDLKPETRPLPRVVY